MRHLLESLNEGLVDKVSNLALTKLKGLSAHSGVNPQLVVLNLSVIVVILLPGAILKLGDTDCPPN